MNLCRFLWGSMDILTLILPIHDHGISLFIFVFVTFVSVSDLKLMAKSCQGAYYLFFFKRFTISGLRFKSLMRFDFYVWCEVVVWFHPFACSCPVSQTPSFEEIVLPQCVFLVPFS